jgi:MtrB/PioB family decaheme-associated outer membrane protein
MKSLKQYKAGLLTTSLVLIAAPALAAGPADWKCQYCPFEEGYHADYTAGVSNVSDDAAHFGDATGYDEEGTYLNLDGSGSFASNGYQMKWLVEDLGLDSRFLELEGGKQGNYGYRVSYREIPHHVFDTTSTVFIQNGDNSLGLPSDWVFAGTTSGFTALDANLVQQNIESSRQIVEVGGHYLPSTKLKFFANYRQQTNDGVDVTAGSFYAQSSLMPRPFDYSTDELDIGLRYRGSNGYLQLAYYGSFFSNSSPDFLWNSPFTSALGSTQAALAQPPENTFQQVGLSGSWSTPVYRTVATFSATRGLMEQDEALLPYTTNPNLLTAALPTQSLNGEVVTSNVALTVTSRPLPKARVKLAYRLDDRDNQTAQREWSRVIADTFNSGSLTTNLPYSFKRMRLNASADYDLLKSVKVSAGYDRTDFDRDFQEVASQTEDTGWGQLRWRPSGLIDFKIRGGSSERTINSYDEAYASSLDQNPLMRKYNLAYRYRRFGDMTATASLPHTPASLTVSALYADDSYSYALLGINEAEKREVTADLSWAISDKASLYVMGGYENIDSTQSGSEQFSFVDWQAKNTDTFNTTGAGFRIKNIAEKVDLQLDYSKSDGSTEIELTSINRALSQLPDLESTLDTLRFRLLYKYSERMQMNLQLRYQSLTAEDWALDGVEPSTIPNVLTLGADPYDYDVYVISLGFRYWIGVDRKPGQ